MQYKLLQTHKIVLQKNKFVFETHKCRDQTSPLGPGGRDETGAEQQCHEQDQHPAQPHGQQQTAKGSVDHQQIAIIRQHQQSEGVAKDDIPAKVDENTKGHYDNQPHHPPAQKTFACSSTLSKSHAYRYGNTDCTRNCTKCKETDGLNSNIEGDGTVNVQGSWGVGRGRGGW